MAKSVKKNEEIKEKSRVKPTSIKAGASAGNTSVHKTILRQVHHLFNKEGNGLGEMCKFLDLKARAPREKINVLIVGNHSAGKSSFINWYVKDNIQKESMAMETSGFTFVTSGKKRDTFRGAATLRAFDYLKGIEKFEGVVNHLSTEVVDSNHRNFPMVDLIDTPGLTDGKLQYAFPVNDIIAWLADRVDLIFVFFDPHGQATCERTMNIVKQLHQQKSNKGKVHYFLTKADTIENERERLKVLSQVSQSLSRVVADESSNSFYGEHALEVKSIYRPLENEKDDEHEFNQINEVIDLVNLTIKQNVQQHCEHLEKACTEITGQIDQEVADYRNNGNWNSKVLSYMFAVWLVAFSLPMLLLGYILHFVQSVVPMVYKQHTAVKYLLQGIKICCGVVGAFDQSEFRYHILGGMFAVFAVLILLGKFLGSRRVAVRSFGQMKQMKQWRIYVKKISHPKEGVVNKLWGMYLNDSTV